MTTSNDVSQYVGADDALMQHIEEAIQNFLQQ